MSSRTITTCNFNTIGNITNMIGDKNIFSNLMSMFKITENTKYIFSVFTISNFVTEILNSKIMKLKIADFKVMRMRLKSK